MKFNIYSIFDTASGLYSRPHFNGADAESMRAFENFAVEEGSPVQMHPGDYSLHRIGIFDDNNGKLVNEDNECLLTALEAVARSRKINHGAQKDLVEEIEHKTLKEAM